VSLTACAVGDLEGGCAWLALDLDKCTLHEMQVCVSSWTFHVCTDCNRPTVVSSIIEYSCMLRSDDMAMVLQVTLRGP
jgi:hypothetical protein